MPEAIILPEVQVELLRRDDAKYTKIKHTLKALERITSLPWIVSQHGADAPYTYALDDAHLPLTARTSWETYTAISDTVNDAVNNHSTVVAHYKNRRGVFSLNANGVRVATVGGILHNGKKLASSLQLAAIVEEPDVLDILSTIDFKKIAAPVRKILKEKKAEAELLKALEERTSI